MNEEPFDFAAALGGLARHWLAVVALVVVGTAGGLAVALAAGPTYVARAGVLLPPAGADALGNPVRDMETEARVAESSEVLARAGAGLRPPLAPAEVDARVSVIAATSEILDIRASASGARRAVELADAVAHAYVAVRNEATAATAGTSTVDLQAQAAELDERIRRLTEEISAGAAGLAGVAPASPEALRRSAAVDSMRTRAADAARELAGVNGKLATVRLEADLERRGTKVIDAASSGGSSGADPLRQAGAGGLAGLVAGLGLALFLDHSDRGRRRADDMDAANGHAVAAGGDAHPSATTPGGNGSHRASRPTMLEVARPGLARWRDTRVAAPSADHREPDDSAAGEFSPFVKVPALLAAARRQWWLVGACALAGVAAAVGLSSVSPPLDRAATGILVRHPSGTDPNREILTDVALARTRTVADGASVRLGGAPGGAELLDGYQAAPRSTELLEVTATGPDGREAVRRAQAVAESFVAFRQERFRQQWEAAADSIRARQDVLAAELREVDGRLEGLAAPNPGGAAVKGAAELQSRKGAIAGEMAVLSRQLAQGNLDTEGVIAASRIIDPASSLDAARGRTLALNVVAGGILGLALGAGWVVLREVTAARVLRREDVGRLLGAPVGVSVGHVARRLWAHRLRSGAHSRRGRDVNRLVRHLRNTLVRTGAGGAGRQALTVVSVDSDVAAVVATAKLADDLSQAGRSVLVADLTGRALVPGRLRVADDQVMHVKGRSDAPCVALGPIDQRLRLEGSRRHRDYASLRRHADVVLTVAALDPSEGAYDLAEWASSAVVVVTAGRSSSTAVASVGRMLRAAGIEVDSAVVVDADPGDETVGVAPPPVVDDAPTSVWVRR